MARFRKVDPVIWNDERFRALSDDGKLAFLFLLTHPSMTALGAMRATVQGLAAELGWGDRRLRTALTPAMDSQMVIVDEAASFLRLRNFLHHNAPENPNQVRAWRSAAEFIPECPGKVDLLLDARTLVEQLGEPFAKPFRERFPELFGQPSGHGLPIYEQEQEIEQEQEEESESESARAREDGPEVPEDLRTVLVDTTHFAVLAGRRYGAAWETVQRTYARYDWLDLGAEVRAADAWIACNPRKAPTPAGRMRFLGNWFKRAVESGRTKIPSEVRRGRANTGGARAEEPRAAGGAEGEGDRWQAEAERARERNRRRLAAAAGSGPDLRPVR